ncbi:hypothetical protein ACJIZ3_004534 [Penstemon smallii]|uniref:Exonuclease 1 n=1 Tax=Penstemon smallii TaxID=265156 RepID=A0ABD3S2B1_9LAMI
MGINNLLKFMKPYVKPVHVKKYAGKRVGIDAYSWLHKGAYSCSMELCLDMEGDKKFQYIKYFMHRINMLRHYKITPVVVFDGGNIPCKATTENERHRKRKDNRDKAMDKLKEGDVNAASELFQRAVSITPLMARQLIQVLRSENIEFVVAPYEADAQLAYLSGLEAEKGGIVAVISEDSDLLAYGCPAIVFKMDKFGNGEEIVLDEVLNSVGSVPSFNNFDQELFTGMCILAGCDFLPSVPGVGIAKAYNLVAKYRNLARVLSTLKFEKGKQVPEDYAKAFKEAVAVFQHARVYDAVSKKLKPLKPLSPELLQSEIGDLDFLGPDLSPSLAIAIAEGNLDPSTMEAFDHFPQPKYQNHLSSFPDSTALFFKQDKTTESTKEGCFTIVSRHRTAKKRIRGDTPPNVMINNLEEGKPKTTVEEVLHSGEALVLEKLVFPIKTKATEETTKVSVEFASKVPNNNPFKKRKLDEVQLKQVDELASEVTTIENSEILCGNPESQNRVDSKLVTSVSQNSKSKGEILTIQDSKHLEPKRSSILNFFSRV